MYVDLLANPPPSPHPFGAFLEEAACLRTRAAAVASPNTARGANDSEGASSGLVVAGDENAEPPSLRELLRKEHGYSAGTAMHRIWVECPQEYLAGMARRIADVVSTCVMPLLASEKNGGGVSPSQPETIKASGTTPVAGAERDRYDIHVRFLPSSAPRLQFHAPISKVFCAEVIVRDVEALQRLEEDADLLRVQYTSVAAEGQTVQSALAFWRGVKVDAVVEDSEGLSADGISSAIVLGRTSDPGNTRRVRKTSAGEERAAWMQPPAKRSRQATTSAAAAATASSSNTRRRTAPQTTESEAPQVLLQSSAGLVAVFYLAFSGALYTGVVCGAADPPTSPAPPRVEASSDDTLAEKRVEATATPQDAEPVLFLPCASSTSFVCGLLGL
ncbi:hypothetical protein TraAM80_02397 [Trypanosoma rangeli]|uniref:Uncharacterized protein n=1 Tax=Trypanosoma rangeli TaxID=5698 RepID=A0A3R7MPD7_TRYRA|nr:uncharacterized protein TraAM80_02397 [Trypanosoma rangeli]RNF09138.1 hypothetical protein TraAM80_02397 [Trypanosoma rangeli]|eukprot:RNF09138.1 hypothetical protein TraAM80_02397 [Trypanosoma rangeli]